MSYNRQPKKRRIAKIQKKIRGKSDRPRLSVFRSNKYIYTQIIDDEKQITLVAVSEKKLDSPMSEQSKIKTKGKTKQQTEIKAKKLTKTEKAALVGEMLANLTKKKGISKVSFDRRAYKYHGRIKAIAEAARKGGLVF